MERDYLIKTIENLLIECNDMELLYLVKSLLSVKS